MSSALDALLAIAENDDELTTTLSPESQVVILFGLEFLMLRENWIETVDDVTDEDWDTIQAMVAEAQKGLIP